MARQRMIKPEFFLHDELAELPPLHRLLFIGLWTLADREGRLEDRPKRIKAALFPWDDLDADAALSSLRDAGFIVRYEAGGAACIAIPSFSRHQKPHVREAPSTIPPPEHSSGGDQALPRRCPGTTKASGMKAKVSSMEAKVSGMEAKAMPSPLESESESESESVVVGVAEPPPLTLEPTKPQKPPKKPSAQQRFWAWAQKVRAEEGMLPDSRWPEPRINKLLAWVAGHPPEAVTAAYGLFLDDERMQAQSPPCPMAFFASDWPKWMDMAEREGLLDAVDAREAVSP